MHFSHRGQMSLPVRHMLASSGPQLPCPGDQPSPVLAAPTRWLARVTKPRCKLQLHALHPFPHPESPTRGQGAEGGTKQVSSRSAITAVRLSQNGEGALLYDGGLYYSVK